MKHYTVNSHALSWPARLGMVLLSGVALLAGITLAAFLLVFAVLLAASFGGWLWWQTRRLRRATQGGGEVIEGEYQIETEYRVLENHPSRASAHSDFFKDS